jgi:hypothetical protein
MTKPVLAGRGRIAGVLGVGRGAAAALLIAEEFTAVNGTNLSGRAPSPINVPGTVWSVFGTATWTIQSGRATKTSGGGQNLVVANAGVANAVIVCDVTVGNSAERQGLAIRATDTNNLWIFGWNNSNVIQIFERTAGAGAVRASAALTLTVGSTHEFAVVCSGTTIIGFVDGVQYVSYATATAHQSVTNHGLYAGSTAAPAWDNFELSA